MPTSVLLSVKPQFASAIFAGSKLFEFRRALFKDCNVSRIVVYASSPVQRVIGEFVIAEILSMSPAQLWAETHHGAGITRQHFTFYFRGRSVAHAIRVAEVRLYSRPRELQKHYGVHRPPQSFCYLD
jgi:predicted transcriptional regulator